MRKIAVQRLERFDPVAPLQLPVLAREAMLLAQHQRPLSSNDGRHAAEKRPRYGRTLTAYAHLEATLDPAARHHHWIDLIEEGVHGVGVAVRENNHLIETAE